MASDFWHLFFKNELEGTYKQLSKADPNFKRGLGEGMGHYLTSAGSQLVEEVMRTTGSVALEKGAARGIAESFGHLNLAARFASFGEDTQSIALDAVMHDNNFSSAFVRAIAKSLVYLSPKTRERLSSMATQLAHLGTVIEKK